MSVRGFLEYLSGHSKKQCHHVQLWPLVLFLLLPLVVPASALRSSGEDSAPSPGDGTYPQPSPAWASKSGFLLQGGAPQCRGNFRGPINKIQEGCGATPKGTSKLAREAMVGMPNPIGRLGLLDLFSRRGLLPKSQRGTGILLITFQKASYWHKCPYNENRIGC